jgi:hypothetical protein
MDYPAGILIYPPLIPPFQKQKWGEPAASPIFAL